ncbi:MAG: flagellar basal-body rod protein FlgF [Oligoflexia bacterium]|nr:flagellar basal-body rod protein FlgF [Oligoflexia bacterium]
MSKGLWPAISGSMAQSQKLDTIANNIANADTDGFKRDQVSFRAMMSSAITAYQKEGIPKMPYKEKDFYRLDGTDKAYAHVEGTYTDQSQGRLKITNSPLDVALEGKGFLEVLGPQGLGYTRNGNLKLNAEGALVTTEGYPVLSPGGLANEAREESAARAITIDPKGGTPTITADGKIYQNKVEIGQLAVVEFIDGRLLAKEGSSLFKNTVAANLSNEVPSTKIHQGMIESSNVNAIQEMTELLQATRLFEANEKVVKTYGELEGRAVNELGKF